MSTTLENSPIFAFNTDENTIESNEQSYNDLIDYCALRKQFARIIPSYYTEIQKQSFNNKKQNNSSIEEYKKLKEEINIMKESIEVLRESKQKKLKQIEDLRILMRKVGKKQITHQEKKEINNNIINNYCCREKQNNDQNCRCRERKGSSSGFKVSSDEGLSIAPTTSGLSSGKDDDAGAEEGRNQPGPDGFYNNGNSSSSNSSSGSWCFTREENNNDLMLHYSTKSTKDTTMPLQNSN